MILKRLNEFLNLSFNWCSLKKLLYEFFSYYDRKLTEITVHSTHPQILNIKLFSTKIHSQSHERIFSEMKIKWPMRLKALSTCCRRKYHTLSETDTIFCEALYRTLLSSIGNNFSSGFSNIFPQTHPVTECSCNSKSLYSALITRMVIYSVSQVYTKLLTGLNFWIESFKRKLKCMWNWCYSYIRKTFTFCCIFASPIQLFNNKTIYFWFPHYIKYIIVSCIYYTYQYTEFCSLNSDMLAVGSAH